MFHRTLEENHLQYAVINIPVNVTGINAAQMNNHHGHCGDHYTYILLCPNGDVLAYMIILVFHHQCFSDISHVTIKNHTEYLSGLLTVIVK